MRLTILGSSSATPIYDRHPSSQVLSIDDTPYLIDCGEGTLFRINAFHVRKNKIKAIFISHLHGDHYYGLIGLLTTMSMQERTEPLTIVSPARLQDIIRLQCEISKTILRFEIIYKEFDNLESLDIYEDNHVRVSTIPLNHKITTCGFRFDKKMPPYRIDKNKIEQYDLSTFAIKELIAGKSVSVDNQFITLSDISIPVLESKSYAYISDTAYHDSIVSKIQNIDLLYHEATFLESERARADATKHSTGKDAGTIATKGNVKKLLIGHFSARYQDLNPILEETCSQFTNTALALEGLSFDI
jgi:ribonuclease Z